MINHWAGRWLGTPWVAGDTDCWNLARKVWAAQFARDVPPVVFDPVSAFDTRRAIRNFDLGQWSLTDEPREGDAVMMARGTTPCHVGIYLAGGMVLHAVEGAGAICTAIDGLSRVGFRVVGFYGWVG